MEFDVLIEIPRGSRNKYEVDHHTGLRETQEPG
jgi:inorganic pyrophosphatase